MAVPRSGININKDNLNPRRFSSAGAFAELFALEGPPVRFLTELLATQCRQAKADAAVLLRTGAQDRTEILATFPRLGDSAASMSWLRKTEKPFRKAIQTAETVILREDSGAQTRSGPQRYLIVLPIQSQGVVRAAAAFRIKVHRREKLLLSCARIETTPLLLDHRELQLTLGMHLASLNRLRCVLEVLDATNRSTRFMETGMVLCNEIATRFGCSRVSLGVLEGRCVRVQAMSHTDTFSREMQVVQAIESCMEECLDQDLEIVHPADDAAMTASRAAAALSKNHGPSAVLSLPIRQGGDVAAVLTLERQPGQQFENLEEIETIRLVCDLCAPRLLDLRRNDRWFGARMMSEARDHLGGLLGHGHTWIKLGAALIFLLCALAATTRGEYRIRVPFAFKAKLQQAVVAPFDSFSKSVLVEPGDRVAGGKTILGTLETTDLRLKLAALKAEQLEYQKQMMASMRDRNTAQAQIAEAQSDKVAAQIRMIDKKIEQARLVAPMDGWVVSEDRRQLIGAPVEAGQVLFEIVRIDSLRAELYVPEALIASVSAGQTGTLASVGHPEMKIHFDIEQINPIAEVVNHQNVFRVRARISEHMEWMRPGMEGEARILAGRKTYLWMASHGFVNWLRMKLWL